MSWLSRYWKNYFEQRMLRGHPPLALNRRQEAFCDWNASRLGITDTESRERFSRSWAALAGGHHGHHFKVYSKIHMEICEPFWGNSPAELPQTYAAHEPLQFLRLLSYAEPRFTDWPELQNLAHQPAPMIVDFGCGLAHFATMCAQAVREQGGCPKLCLVDLPLLQLEFLRWLCGRWEIDASFLECTPERPLPDLPACDLCVALEILEHVHEPMKYLQALAAAVKPGGFMVTNLVDHHEEFVHVSPKLGSLHEHLIATGWWMVRPLRLYQKP
jgi:SAM-dependent methyltransferase